jgi:hypothetical protein
MDDDEKSLLRFLVEVDTPNYELIDAMVAIMDA